MSSEKNQLRPSLEAEHTPEAIRQRLRGPMKHSYLRDFIYGAIDGTVTTFAVVCGVQGAGLSARVVVILGFANPVRTALQTKTVSWLAGARK